MRVVCENSDVQKIEIPNFYVISIYFDYKIEYFYREKPLNLNDVQTPTSTN